MYYIDRDQIEQRLDFLTHLQKITGTLQPNIYEDAIHKLAGERVVQLALEAVTDVGSLLIDGFIMRDPASYEDIIDILLDEKVVPPESYDSLTQLVQMRKPLMQQFYSLDAQLMQSILTGLDGLIELFVDAVRNYLDKELRVS